MKGKKKKKESSKTRSNCNNSRVQLFSNGAKSDSFRVFLKIHEFRLVCIIIHKNTAFFDIRFFSNI